MTTERNDEILEITRNFLDGLKFSGPISVEFKVDTDGRYWLIEPNVGRTEFCVDLAIQAGVNFPLLEYADQIDTNCLGVEPRNMSECTWYDTVKEPLCYIKHTVASLARGDSLKRPVFPYFLHRDWAPFLSALIRPITDQFRRLFRPNDK